MSEPFQAVSTKADLETLDSAEIVAGYVEFVRGDPEPGPNRGRAYWHGYMNAKRDHHESPMTAEAMNLAHEYNSLIYQ
jgi:hypothetical protein